ncbi:uncharacterized protein LOC129330893 isoform X2 [Eublepharis macularius]|uniref:Uncharacterized protein LOC129330893 isoform X2 n=1 Tax=Eublepharis macularius TaxID=481883 RepID=A0AA97L0F6_EUBMA|nr:uncharacterized protein LOC129330893 isoform X2 [Eublepharis macularius]
MISHRMEQLSGFLVILVLTGPFLLSKTHSSATPTIPFLKRPNTGERNRELTVLQGESLRIYLFCGQGNLNTKKVWCKEECFHTNPPVFSKSKWKVLSTASNEKVRLGDLRKGCASVYMTTVKIEDSGLYWFGLLNGQKIDYLSPIQIVVLKDLPVPGTTVSPSTFRMSSFERLSQTEWRPIEVMVGQGKNLSIVVFCGQQHLKTEKVWCKGELLKECILKAPVQLLEQGWKYLTTKPSQRVVIRNSTNGCFSVFMSDLQLEDSGIYWFGFLDGWNIIPFKKITVIVQEEQKNIGNLTVTRENKSSIYHVVLVAGSTVAGILIIASITTLAVMMLTKRNARDFTPGN